MHFRSDEKFLELTKILEIQNKGNYRGSVPIFRRPKCHFAKIFLVSVFWNTLVQVGVKVQWNLVYTSQIEILITNFWVLEIFMTNLILAIFES